MNGLAIICLIFYIIGGYLVFKNWGTSGDKDKYNWRCFVYNSYGIIGYNWSYR